jgi:cellobiose phosphorylase
MKILTNGRYQVMLTQAGNGYSRWKDLAVTRWREDGMTQYWGVKIYLRDSKTDDFRIANSDYTEVIVSSEEDMEIRRTRFHNRSAVNQTIALTTYAEVVLNAQADDEAEPAFSNLFVETQWLKEQTTLLAFRRPRSEQEKAVWMYHKLNIYSTTNYQLSFETNRDNFIGRGGTPTSPAAMMQLGDLSNTVGPVLDPIVAIRCQITLKPDEPIVLDLINGVTNDKNDCIRIIKEYQERHVVDRQFELNKPL